ncbi:MAG: ABC transporter substrate-binding protein [Clostridia bacterium]|nr:ABC transporter substrate-binding protein [Clostridia bacterium]
MKKILSLILVIILTSALLVSCGAPATTDIESGSVTDSAVDTDDTTESAEIPANDVTVRVAGMTGPTSIGMVKVISDAANGTAKGNYSFTIAGSADEISPLLIKGELDIAAVPANLASVLYNKTEGGIKLIAVNNLGVLYVLDKNSGVSSVEDLKGKTIYATGKNATPEYTLKHVLIANGIDPENDVTIEFKSEPAEIVALLKESDSGIAMLPQPYVTVAKTQVEGLETVLDLGAEWKKVNPDSETVTGVIVARSEFINENPEAVATFLEEYTASCEFVNTNVEEAAVLIEEAGIFKAAIAKQAIPYCNVTGNVGEEVKPMVNGYLNVLFEQNPASIGGKIPADDFFYIAE